MFIGSVYGHLDVRLYYYHTLRARICKWSHSIISCSQMCGKVEVGIE